MHGVHSVHGRARYAGCAMCMHGCTRVLEMGVPHVNTGVYGYEWVCMGV